MLLIDPPCHIELIGSRLPISDQQISLTLQRSFIDAFDDFSKDLLSACSYEPGAGSLPVTVIPSETDILIYQFSRT